jgi:hypothetical protein
MAEHTSTSPVSVEQWKPVVGFETCYSISNFGRVRRDKAIKGTRVGKILKSTPDRKGYHYVMLHNQKPRQRGYIHKLVAAAFIGKCPDGLEINHINSNPADNRQNNLEYVTHGMNIEHSYRSGFRIHHDCHGELNPACVLDESTVRSIRSDLARGMTLHQGKRKWLSAKPADSCVACFIRTHGAPAGGSG